MHTSAICYGVRGERQDGLLWLAVLLPVLRVNMLHFLKSLLPVKPQCYVMGWWYLRRNGFKRVKDGPGLHYGISSKVNVSVKREKVALTQLGELGAQRTQVN